MWCPCDYGQVFSEPQAYWSTNLYSVVHWLSLCLKLPSLFSLSPTPLLSFLPSLFSQRFQLPSIKSSRAMVLCQRKAMVWVSSLRMTRFSLVSALSAMHNIQTLAASSIFRNWETAWQKCMISWWPLEDSPQSCDISDLVSVHLLL